MPEFAQLGGQHPVLATIPVVNKAEGTEVMSKLFGKISEVAVKEAININNDQSNQTLISASTQTQNVIHDTKQQILKDPANAAIYAENSEKLLQTISNVPLNKQDRKKLEYYTSNANNTIGDQAFKAEFDQEQKIHQAAYYENMQANVQLLAQHISSGDFAHAESLMEDWREINKKALLTGIITPSVYSNQEKLVQGYIERAQIMHDAFGQTDVVQQNEHLNTPLVAANNLQERPLEPGTQHLFNYYRHLKTTDDLNNAIVSGSHNPDVIKHLFNLPEQQFFDKYTLWSGANNINAMMQSNHNFAELDQLKKDLDNSIEPLDTYQKGQLGRLNLLFNKLSNGEYIDVLNQTGEGARLTDSLNKQLAAINNGIYFDLNPETVEQKKSELTNQAMNQYYSDMYSLGDTMHIPRQYIKPMPQQMMIKASGAFEKNGNPSDLISTLKGLNSENQVHLAKQLSNPVQSEIAYTIGLGNNHDMKPEFAHSVIKAQQPNAFDSKTLNQSSKNNTDDSSLNSYIYNQLGKTITFLQTQPDGADRINTLLEAGRNYAKYQAFQNEDFDLKNKKTYMKEFAQQINTAYQINSNAIFSYNQKQNSQFTKNDISHSAQYLLNIANDNLKKRGVDVDVFNVKSSLQFTILPENIAIVYDQFGNTYASHHLNSDFVHAAYEHTKDFYDDENKQDEAVSKLVAAKMGNTELYKPLL